MGPKLKFEAQLVKCCREMACETEVNYMSSEENSNYASKYQILVPA
jgi:hypothetical protein